MSTSEPETHIYRGVVITSTGRILYGKPYNKIGPAKAWVTSTRRGNRAIPSANYEDGFIQRVKEWEKVDV